MERHEVKRGVGRENMEVCRLDINSNNLGWTSRISLIIPFAARSFIFMSEKKMDAMRVAIDFCRENDYMPIFGKNDDQKEFDNLYYVKN